MLIVTFTGALAGLVHVLSGPDHLAAVAPFTVEDRSRSWLVGLKWGIGHTSGVWILGLLAILLRELLPIDVLSSWSERLVGVVLIGIGFWGLKRAFSTQLHYHVHEHDGIQHAHVHVHQKGERHDHREAHMHRHAPIGIGLLHGLAGTSHLFGILPALALPTRYASALYVIGFGVGSILAMTSFSWVLGHVVQRLVQYSLKAYNWMLGSFAVVAILVGVVWISTTLH